MVDLLFEEAQAEAAGHKERLKESVQRNERKATELIRRDWNKLQQNVSEARHRTERKSGLPHCRLLIGCCLLLLLCRVCAECWVCGGDP